MTIWRAYTALGIAVISSYLLLPSGLPRDALYLVVGLSSVAAICVGLRLNRPSSRAPWWFLAAGQMAWVLGDTIYSWNQDVRHVEPFPSAADVAYLAAYPLIAAGVGLLIRRRGMRFDLPGLIDSAVVVIGLGLVSWSWFAGPLLSAPEVPVLERLVAVAYPVGDIFLLAMLVRLIAAPGTRSTAFRLLVGAVGLQVVADTALAAQPSSNWNYASALDLLWLGSYVLWGASALHPHMVGLVRHPGSRHDRFTVRRLITLSTAALLPPATFMVSLALGRDVDDGLIVAAAVVLPCLVLARMACAIEEIRRRAGQQDKLQEDLFHEATHDTLTGLFNRTYLLRLTESALRRGQVAGTATGLLVIDIDRFTAINDEWGPATGDAILRETARRIRGVAGSTRPVGRLGDDQFVVLVESSDAEEESIRLANVLVDALEDPHPHGSHLINPMARIGLSVSLDGGTSATDLLQEAQIAQRRAQASNPGSIEVFDHRMRREHNHRAKVESALRQALAKGELELRYQPVVAATTEVVDGYEALVRWQEPDGTVRMPDEFIPIAEKTELICEVGRWVLGQATRQFREWLDTDPDRFRDLTVAVNISGRHLADHRIVDDVAAALDAAGIDAHHLAIEVTETALVEVPNSVLQLDMLRGLGVTISLDDFGTGYTSIEQLRHLPLDTIKIDKSFLDPNEPGSSELVALMTAAAHACGMLVIAEGVESRLQLSVIRELECDAAQGYLFARPLTAAMVLSGAEPVSPARLRVVRDS